MDIQGLSKNIVIKSLERINGAGLKAELSPGDLIRAVVIETDGDSALLKLSDGSIVKASLAQSVELTEGETVDFIVTGKIGESAVLRIQNLENPAAFGAETAKAFANVFGDAMNVADELRQLGFPVNDDTVSVAAAVKNLGHEISGAIFEKVRDAVEKFPQLGMKEAVFLVVAGLGINDENVSAVLQLGKGFGIGTSLLEVLKLFNERFSDNETSGNGAPSSSTDIISDNVLPPGNGINSDSELLPGNSTVSENTLSSGKNKFSENELPSGKSIFFENELPSGKNVFSGNALPSGKSIVSENALPSGNSINSDNAMLTGNSIFSGNGMPAENSTDSGIPDSTMISDNNLAPGHNPVSDDIFSAENLQPEEILQGSADALGGIFINPAENLSGEKIREAYEAILEKLDSLRGMLSREGAEANVELSRRIENIENNIRFMGELNRYITYVQIPLVLQQHRTTARLFVMRRRRTSGSINPENMTVYVSLETANMGQVDSLVSVSGKAVSINIRSDKENVVALFKKSFALIHNMLREKGYRLADYRCMTAQNPAGIVETVELLEREYRSELERRGRTVDFKV